MTKINKKAAFATIRFWLAFISIASALFIIATYPNIAMPFVLIFVFIFVTYGVYKINDNTDYSDPFI